MSFHSKSLKPNDFVKTPDWITTYLANHYGPFFDPCPVNPTFDGLAIEWGRADPDALFTYWNPPYSTKDVWVQKAIRESKRGGPSIGLLPVDLSATWAVHLDQADARFRPLSPRLKFKSDGSPWFSSMFVFLSLEPHDGKGRFAIWRVKDMRSDLNNRLVVVGDVVT